MQTRRDVARTQGYSGPLQIESDVDPVVAPHGARPETIRALFDEMQRMEAGRMDLAMGQKNLQPGEARKRPNEGWERESENETQAQKRVRSMDPCMKPSLRSDDEPGTTGLSVSVPPLRPPNAHHTLRNNPPEKRSKKKDRDAPSYANDSWWPTNGWLGRLVQGIQHAMIGGQPTSVVGSGRAHRSTNERQTPLVTLGHATTTSSVNPPLSITPLLDIHAQRFDGGAEKRTTHLTQSAVTTVDNNHHRLVASRQTSTMPIQHAETIQIEPFQVLPTDHVMQRVPTQWAHGHTQEPSSTVVSVGLLNNPMDIRTTLQPRNS